LPTSRKCTTDRILPLYRTNYSRSRQLKKSGKVRVGGKEAREGAKEGSLGRNSERRQFLSFCLGPLRSRNGVGCCSPAQLRRHGGAFTDTLTLDQGERTRTGTMRSSCGLQLLGGSRAFTMCLTGKIHV